MRSGRGSPDAHDPGEAAEPLFELHGGAYHPSPHTRGPWDAGSQHGGAPAALVAREIERTGPGEEMFVARVTYEFLGAVPIEPLTISAEIVRPGKRLQVLEAELRAHDRTVARARAVRLRRTALELPSAALAGGEPSPPPSSGRYAPFPDSSGDDGFHRTAMEISWLAGSYGERGPASAWFRLRSPVVADEAPTPLQRTVAAADFGNGVSRVLDFDKHLFVNTDLTVHLHREARDEWVLLDSRTVADPGGAGLATSALSDQEGPIGVAAQTLYVDIR
jgi:hypothetical protein